ncbi:MAG: S41 family peptidase [Dethiobacteria bacterium]|jgi:carboxyl-terminal processing protease
MRQRGIIILLLCLLLLSNMATYHLTRFFFFTEEVRVSWDENGIGSFWEVWDILENGYFQRLEKEKMVHGAIQGMIGSLNDPYTTYLNPRELEEMQVSTMGHFGGIGVEIINDEGGILIVRVMEGSPAAEVGLSQGDYIVRVDNKTLENIALEEVARLLRGPEGTQVNLAIRRPGEKDLLQMTLTRADIEVETVFIRLLTPGTGYLQITNFDKDTGKDFINALSALEKEGLKELIIDLRSNPGGLLDEAIEVGEIIVPEGEITRVVDRWGKVLQRYYSKAKPKDYAMVVLVDEYTASAAEIIAGALQDNGIPLVGMPTFGKATIQYLQDLSDGAMLRYTVAKYLTPLGHDLSQQGLQPDQKVELPPEYCLQYCPVPRDLQEGDIGERVALLQKMLIFLGYPLEVTGVFDRQTLDALKAFQKKHLLPCNGTLDSRTREKLRSMLANEAGKVDTQLAAALEMIKGWKVQGPGK